MIVVLKVEHFARDAQSIRQRFYCDTAENQGCLEAEVEHMLEHNIAEPSNSSWALLCL